MAGDGSVSLVWRKDGFFTLQWVFYVVVTLILLSRECFAIISRH